MNVTIKTNNHWRQFVYRYDVPSKVLADQFDYLSDDVIDGFFKYRGNWYHLDEFMRIENNPDSEFSQWHGYSGDSYFSGIVIRISKDADTYQIGTYYS